MFLGALEGVPELQPVALLRAPPPPGAAGPSPAGSAPKAGRPATRRQGSPRAGQQTTGRMSAAKSLFCLFRPSTAKASGRPAACPETPK